MAPLPGRAVQKRRRHISQVDGFGSFFSKEPRNRRTKPLITYGTAKKPLPLSGGQFLRKDLYELSSDDDEDEVVPAPARTKAPIFTTVQRHDDLDDSPLSDAEPVQLRKEAVKPRRRILQDSDFDFDPPLSDAEPEPQETAQSVTFPLQDKTAVPAKIASPDQTIPRRHISQDSDFDFDALLPKAEPDNQEKARKVKLSSATKGTVPAKDIPPDQRRQSKSIPSKETRRQVKATLPAKTPIKRGRKAGIEVSKIRRPEVASEPHRRLPISDLDLAPDSSTPDEIGRDPASSPSGVQTQDPIKDSSGRNWIPSTESGKPISKAPLRAIRKRLRTSSFRTKSLKRKRSGWEHYAVDERVIRGGDGFEVSETQLTYCAKKLATRRRLRGKASLAVRFKALQLTSGLLPDVVFKPEEDSLPLEREAKDAFALNVQQTAVPTESSLFSRRVVSSSDRDDIIMAQLSSISAPERQVSDDESETDDEEEVEEAEEPDEEDESVSQDNHTMYNELIESAEETEVNTLSSAVSYVYAGKYHAPPPNNQMQHPRSLLNQINSGVSFDFRKSDGLGVMPRKPLGGHRLMEVDDIIFDPPEIRQTKESSNDYPDCEKEAESAVSVPLKLCLCGQELEGGISERG